MNNFKKIVLYFTLRESDKRLYRSYETERQRLELLSDRELHAQYVKVKSHFELKKTYSTFIVLTLFLSILTGVWKIFFEVIHEIFMLFINEQNSVELTKIILPLTFFLFSIFVLVLLVCTSLYLRNMFRLYGQIMLIEEVLKKKDVDN